MIADAVHAAELVVTAAVLWAGAAAAALAFVAVVVLLGIPLLVAPGVKAARSRCTPASRPRQSSGVSRDAGAPERAAERRVRRRPAWAHEQPVDYQEAA